MTKEYLARPNDTVFNYFILPLIGLNIHSFGECEIKTLMNRLGDLVYIKVTGINTVPVSITNSPNFKENKENKYLIFSIPKEFNLDTRKIIKGRYSEISEKSKNIIRSGSGLAYKKKTTEGFITSKALYALDKDPILLNFFQQSLKLTVQEVNDCLVEPKTELLDKPYDEDFIEYYKVLC